MNNICSVQTDVFGLSGNPATGLSCCKEFDRLYSIIPGSEKYHTNASKASHCRNYLLDDVWWNDVDFAAIAAHVELALLAGATSSTPITISAVINPPMGTSIVVTTINTTVGAVSGALALGGALGYISSVADAALLCNSYVCKAAGDSVACTSTPGFFTGKCWTCTCPNGQSVYRLNNTGWYTFNPSLGNPYRFSTWS